MFLTYQPSADTKQSTDGVCPALAVYYRTTSVQPGRQLGKLLQTLEVISAAMVSQPLAIIT